MPRRTDEVSRSAHPKGRQYSETALREMQSLLGDRVLARDMLIEYLHLVQDTYHQISADHIRALAELMRLSEADIYEVATFYHHFDVVTERDTPPPPVTIRVCTSVSCFLAGASGVLAEAARRADPSRVRVVGSSCIGHCAEAPAALVGRRAVGPVDVDRLLDAAEAPSVDPGRIPRRNRPTSDSYGIVTSLRNGEISPYEIIDRLSLSGLRGLGGAGFPAGRKWAAVRSHPAPRIVTVNADEGEPGTFKDRIILENEPRRVIEGALIAAETVEASRIIVYIRDEYRDVIDIVEDELSFLRAGGGLGGIDVEVRRGAGAYICGEESAMIESIEGKRGWPRHRPPYIAERGVFGRPTLNHNVETLYWVPEIIRRGPDWFLSHGRRGRQGLRSFSVSGRVREPGLKVAPAGTTARELIEEFSGGMLPGHALRGYLPGGASGGMLPASLADEPLDFGTLDRHGCFVGSHAVVVFSDHDDPRAIAGNLMDFFAAESCGQCTPCRVGTVKMRRLLSAAVWDEGLIGELESAMRDASICGLGQAAPNPVRSVLRFFRESET